MGAFTYPRSEPGSSGHLDLVDRLNMFAFTLRDEVAGLPEHALTHRPSETEWSIKEVCGHLCDSTRRLHERLYRMIKLEDPFLPAYDQEETLRARNAQAAPVASLLDEFAAQRGATVEMLGELVHWNWARTGRHEELGRISIRQLVDRAIAQGDGAGCRLTTGALQEPAVFLVSGIPGAGKSTVSRLLAGRFARGVHIDADVLRDMVVSGNAWASSGPPRNPLADPETRAEAERQLRLRARNASLLADAFFEAGYTVVVDEIAIGERLQHFVEDIRGRPLLLVNLAPRLEVVRQRNEARPGKNVFDVWSYLDEEQRRTMRGKGMWLDSSDLTAEETVEEILRRGWEEGQVR
jgi:predicted kinase